MLPVLEATPTTTGVPDLVAATDWGKVVADWEVRKKLVEEALKPGEVADMEFFGTPGDVICPWMLATLRAEPLPVR
jgi:hypothetical protein